MDIAKIQGIFGERPIGDSIIMPLPNSKAEGDNTILILALLAISGVVLYQYLKEQEYVERIEKLKTSVPSCSVIQGL